MITRLPSRKSPALSNRYKPGHAAVRDNAGLLQLWEQAEPQHPLDRALTILRHCDASSRDQSREALAKLSLGQRDLLLLECYRNSFGEHLGGVSDCPDCGEAVEFELPIADLLLPPPDKPQGILKTAGGRLPFRPPNSLDLAAIADCEDMQQAEQQLLARCLANGEAQTMASLTTAEIQQLQQAMKNCDPQAEMLLELSCPACSKQWSSLLDITDFLWQEINDRARRLLWQVQALAYAYGWSEQAILGMSAVRRDFYLQAASS